MEYRQLSSTGERVSELILGAWQFGKANWTDVDDNESIATIQAAIEAGINLIDTAVAYGDGYSEEVVGKALRGRHDKCMIASKVDGNPDLIRQMIDKALQRLQVDVIDLYQIHYPLPRYPVVDAVGAMEELRRAGKIRFIGVSNFSIDQMRQGLEGGRIDTCQPPYNLFWRQYEHDVIPFCQDNGIAVIPYSTLAQGLLTGKFRSREDIPHDIRSNNKLFGEGVFEQCVQVVNRLDEIADKYDKTPAQVAIAWTLQAPGITAPIIGARNRKQLEGNLGAVGFHIAQEEWDALSDAGMKISEQMDFATNMWSYAPA